MLPKTEDPVEQEKQRQFYAKCVEDCFTEIVNFIDANAAKKGLVDKQEIGYILKYHLSYLSEAQVSHIVTTDLEIEEKVPFVAIERVQNLLP